MKKHEGRRERREERRTGKHGKEIPP